MGVDGVWNDMNEPAVFETSDWTMEDNNVHRENRTSKRYSFKIS